MRNEMAEYKKAAQHQQWAMPLTGNTGVYVAPTTGTVTSYAANTLTVSQ